MAKILVTGGAGFIGSHIAEALSRDGNEVAIFDNLSTGYEHNFADFRERITFIKGDLRDATAVNAAVSGKDYIFHEAALASVPRSVDDPVTSNDNNVNGTLNVLVAAKEAQVKRVIYAASSSAYGNSDVSPKHEKLNPDPLSPYAVTKLVGEQYCRAFSEVYGLETLSIRYFNVFGPRQDPNSAYAAVLPIFAGHLLKGESPTIDGDGEQTRDFTFVANVVEGNIKAMQAEKTAGQSVNVACGGSFSINYLYAQVQKQLGTKIAAVHGPCRLGDVEHSMANISLARELIGYEPVVTFEEGLERTVEWYRSTAEVTG
jgi:nucleoside-diphosphate-sugar epimerase